jgi:hypothetical protein
MDRVHLRQHQNGQSMIIRCNLTDILLSNFHKVVGQIQGYIPAQELGEEKSKYNDDVASTFAG